MEPIQSIYKIEKAPCILVYKDRFNPDFFIESLEEETQKEWPYISWGKSKTGDGDDLTISDYRTSLEMPLFPLLIDGITDELKSLQSELQKITWQVNECLWDYRNIYNIMLKEDTGFQLLKYSSDAEYHLHHDHSPENSRVVSIVASMSDGYEGGELEFPYFDITLKLEKGSIAIFPSNYPYSHIAHPVTSGTKYSMVAWFR